MKKKVTVSDIKMVSQEDEYRWAYLSFKSDLDILENLNEQFSKFVSFQNMLDAAKDADFEKELKDYGESIERISKLSKEKGLKNVLISLNTKNRFLKGRYEAIVRSRSTDVIRDMSLVYIVALFENFLQKIFQISFRKKPETLKTCLKNITFEELLGFNDINEARSAIIEKEIMIVNEDIEVVRKYIEQRFGIEISDFVDWKLFAERFYRRNILIHNSGMPNKLYNLKTGKTNDGKRLTVDKEYLTESTALFGLMSLRISLAFAEKMKVAP